jgi:hypothetical protein
MIPQLPILTELNNGILKGRGAMPVKDSTSDGTSFFAFSRKSYRRSYDPHPPTNIINPNDNKINYNQSQSGSFGGVSRTFFSQNLRSMTLPREVPRYQNQKKWMGNSRDASLITEKTRNNAIGIGSLNAKENPTSFMSNTNKNVVSDALIRTRNSGSVVPQKTRVHTTNTSVYGPPY